MIDHELQRIAAIYRATEQDMREVAQRAVAEPLVPVDEIMQRVMVLALDGLNDVDVSKPC
jgi:hypothetical protein